MILPRTAIVLAAGRGVRLRPITDTLPKPLVEIAGRTLLDHAIDRLELAGVERVVVNVHYRAAQIIAHLARRMSPTILISEETEAPLETGGGILNALPLLGDEPFYAVNADSLWLDGRASALHRLAGAWDPARTDAVMLLQRTVTAIGYETDGLGDFSLDQEDRPVRRREGEIVPYLYAGVQLISPILFRDATPGAFSVNRIWDRAIETGRLTGIVHDGEWYHVSTPESLDLVAERFESHRVER
jgi:MurNAc alpha-1-phosphate uridylyltransferase